MYIEYHYCIVLLTAIFTVSMLSSLYFDCIEVQEMEQNLPKTCQTHFDDANKLHVFWLYITPEDGYWYGGRFKFRIDVPEEYNIVVW